MKTPPIDHCLWQRQFFVPSPEIESETPKGLLESIRTVTIPSSKDDARSLQGLASTLKVCEFEAREQCIA